MSRYFVSLGATLLGVAFAGAQGADVYSQTGVTNPIYSEGSYRVVTPTINASIGVGAVKEGAIMRPFITKGNTTRVIQLDSTSASFRSNDYTTAVGVHGNRLLVLSLDVNDLSTKWTYEYPFSGEASEGLQVRGAPGFVYVLGNIGTTPNADFLLLKLNATTGALVWQRRFDANGPGAIDMVLDQTNNVYIAGTTGPEPSKAALVKYNGDGTKLGEVFKTGTSANGAEAVALATEPNQKTTFTLLGTVENTGSAKSDFFVTNYSNALAERWSRTENGNNTPDRGRALAMDNSGVVYALGSLEGAGGSLEARVIKVTASGFKAWTYNSQPAGAKHDFSSIAHVGYGRVAIAGNVQEAGGQPHARVDAIENGAFVWNWDAGEGNFNLVAGGDLVTATGQRKQEGKFLPYKLDLLQFYEANDDHFACPQNGGTSMAYWNQNDRFTNNPVGTFTLTQGPSHGILYNSQWTNYVPTAGYRGPDSFTYQWSWNGHTSSAVVNIDVLQAVRVDASPKILTAGSQSSVGTLTLSSAAEPGGALVTLSSTDPAVVVPATATIPAGQTMATFPITTQPVAAPKDVTVNARINNFSFGVVLRLNTVKLNVVTINPSPVWGGQSALGRVALTGPAPDGGKLVILHSNSPVATVPATVFVIKKHLAAEFQIATSNPTSTTIVTLQATAGSDTVTKSFTVNRVAAQSVSLNPSSVVGGNSATGTVRLNGPAPLGGAQVELYENSVAVTAPANVTVPAGSTSTTFTANTIHLNFQSNCTVRAKYNGLTATTTFVVTP